MLKVWLLLGSVGLASLVPIEDVNTPRDGERCGYESCPKTEAGVLNVHIVPHTHDDVGWLKTVDQYYYGSLNHIQKAGVQYILDSVIKELWEDPARRFIYVETAFFWKWWVRQSSATQDKVHTLVRQGRLQFVGGAWSMNDEAASHYQSTVDQFTWGLKKLNDTFGRCGLPRVGWQIDPFGHSREFASLLAGMGYDGLFLGRIDYQDKAARLRDKRMEMLWRGNDDLGKQSDIFTGILYNTYSPPPGFCFDVLCNDNPIVDDPDSPLYNVEETTRVFTDYVKRQAKRYRTNNVIVTMGGDFTYQDANMWYTNLDKLIVYTNIKAAKEDLNIKLFYSTPTCYLKAVKEANPILPIKQDDFFPYASDPTAFWTGYFTSRPTTKYFEREGNNYLQAIKQIQVLAGLEQHNMFVLNELKSAMGIMQHHDAITGTEKQHVTHDYVRILDQAISDAMLIADQGLNKQIQPEQLSPPLLKFKRCRFNESSCDVTETSDQIVVTVYNSLAWALKATPVRLPVTEGTYEVIAPNGEEIDSQIVELPQQVSTIPARGSRATHEVVFLAYDVPGMGFKAFYVRKKDKISKRDVEKQIEGNKKLYNTFDNIDGYFENIKQNNYIDLNQLNSVSFKKNNNLNSRKEYYYSNIMEEPSPDVYLFINKNPEIDMLKDKNNVRNKNIDDLEALMLEVREKLDNVKDFPPKRELVAARFPRLNEEEMRMLSDDPVLIESYNEEYLGDEHLKLIVDNQTNEISQMIQNGVQTLFKLETLFYPGCVGDNSKPAHRSSGAYIFRPNATIATSFNQNSSKIIKGSVVDEYQYTVNNYVSGIVRVYKHKDIDYVENEWLVGPIPVDDDIGKEIVVRYITDVTNNGEFYTDSNGRQMLKRKLNERPQWNLTLEEPIPGNYYPITNKIYIENEKRVAVLTDRSEGGSSLEEGNIELMLHRRLLHDDAFGVDEALNEMVGNVGLVVRGKHKIVLSRTDNKQSLIDEKRKVLENHLSPIVFVSDAKNVPLSQWLTLKKTVAGINMVPEGIHVLTVEPWDDKLLLRLENYLELTDKVNSSIKVDLTKIFANLKVKAFREATLSANQWKDDHLRWNWRTDDTFFDEFNRAYGNFNYNTKQNSTIEEDVDDALTVEVKAKEIRTFIVDYEL